MRSKAQTQTDGKKPSKGSGLRGESPAGTGGKIPCRKVRWRKSTNPSCKYWLPPACVLITSLNPDANMATYVDSDTPTLRLMCMQPSKKSKKSGVKGSVASRSLYNWFVCLKITIREILFYGKRKLGTKSHCQILQWNVAPHKSSGKQGSIARSYSKV